MPQYDDGLTETQDVSIGDVSDVPMSVVLLGRELKLNKLKLRDYAIAENYLRLQRGRAAKTLMMRGQCPTCGAHAMTLAEEIELVTQAAAVPITMATLCTEFDSRVQLIARGVVGNPGIEEGEALAWVLDNVDPGDHEAIGELVNKITGAVVPLGNSREGKSPPQTETSTPSDLNNGTGG